MVVKSIINRCILRDLFGSLKDSSKHTQHRQSSWVNTLKVNRTTKKYLSMFAGFHSLFIFNHPRPCHSTVSLIPHALW